MLHHLKFDASKRQKIIDAAIESGNELPKFSQAPELSFFETDFWNAYRQLNTCRNNGGPIPWTAINEYCRRFEIVDDDYDEFVSIIGQIDEAHINFMNDKINKEAAKKNNGTNPERIRSKNPFKPAV